MYVSWSSKVNSCANKYVYYMHVCTVYYKFCRFLLQQVLRHDGKLISCTVCKIISRCSAKATEGKHSQEESKQTATITGIYFRIRHNNIWITKTPQCLIQHRPTCARSLKTLICLSELDSDSTFQLSHTVQAWGFVHVGIGDLLMGDCPAVVSP